MIINMKDNDESYNPNEEIWRTIFKFSNYEVSNMGRIRVTKSGKILKPDARTGYQRVTLIGDRQQRKYFGIHVLVAKHFIINGNPDKNDIVDHINHVKSDNRAANLRWYTCSLNTQHYFDTQYVYKGKPILQYDLEGNLIKEWENIRELMKENETYKYDSLMHGLNKGLDKLYGYKWQYKDIKEIKLEKDEVFKKIGMLNGMDFNNFEISNYGKVRNINRNNYLKCDLKEGGYYTVCLYDNITKKTSTIKVHRLVGIYFVDGKTKKKNVVNHLDENPINNYYKNLDWTTIDGNNKYSCCKKVKQVDISTGEVLNAFDSVTDANKYMNTNSINISACCNGKREEAFGYKWEFI